MRRFEVLEQQFLSVSSPKKYQEKAILFISSSLVLGFPWNIAYWQISEIISLKYNLYVPWEIIRKVLQQVDGEGVASRRSNSIKRRLYEAGFPLDILHIDEKDKRKDLF